MRTRQAAALATLTLLTLLIAGCTGGVGETRVSPSGGPTSSVPTDAPRLADVAARAGHTATALADGTVLVAGGCVTDGCSIATADTALISDDAASVEAGPRMSEPRVTHTATRLPGSRVVLIGGFLGVGEGVTPTVDILDPDGLFRAGPALHVARGGHGAVALADGRVLVVGGWIGTHRYTDSVELVDLARNAITSAPSLPWAADALEAVRLEDGRVLVTGGRVSSGVGTDRAAVFDAASGTWTEIGPMLTARFKHAAVPLDDGRVLVIGGTPDDRELLDTTEVFDPQTMTFSPGPRMAEPRYKLSGGAAALPGARVLVGAGGRSVELLDVPLGTTRPVAQLEGVASFATVTLLADGRG